MTLAAAPKFVLCPLKNSQFSPLKKLVAGYVPGLL